jgi:exodeoxyribonuclease-3
MRIATWNVNSVRARMDRIVAFLGRHQVDVLAIQETKAADAKFPIQPLTDAGYQVARHGISQWNGVAIASRVGLTDVRIGLPDCPMFGDPPVVEARAIGARCAGVDVWSLYIPNGREIDDPHYDYKLRWLRALRDMGAARLAADADEQMVLCGDFNVAPTDEDVWDMTAFEGLTHVTQPERDAFEAVVEAGFADLVRPYAPGPGTYTYWDYQQLRFPKKEGMRIDFLLGSPTLTERVTGATIDREERKGKGPSDHAPVFVDTSIDAHPVPVPDGAPVVEAAGCAAGEESAAGCAAGEGAQRARPPTAGRHYGAAQWCRPGGTDRHLGKRPGRPAAAPCRLVGRGRSRTRRAAAARR